MMQPPDILASGGSDYEKNIFCSGICRGFAGSCSLRKPGDSG